MSIDYFIYLRNAYAFSNAQFEQYCAEHGMYIQLHPSFDWTKDSGFVQIHFKDNRFTKEKRMTSYLTGFEFFCDEYHPTTPPQQSTGLFTKILKKKQREETPFEKAIRDSNTVLTLSCSTADSFEVLMAYMFGAYAVNYCDGIFDDPQTGQYYESDHILLSEAAKIVTELTNTDDLLTHPFTDWDN